MSRGILVAIVLLALAAFAALMYVGSVQPTPASFSPVDPTATPWIVTPPAGYQVPPDITGPDVALGIVEDLLGPELHVIESHVAHTTEGHWRMLEGGPDARLVTLAPNETPGAGDPRSEQAQAAIWVVGVRTDALIGDSVLDRAIGVGASAVLGRSSFVSEGDEAYFVLTPLGNVISVGLLTQRLDMQIRRIVPWNLSDIETLPAP